MYLYNICVIIQYIVYSYNYVYLYNIRIFLYALTISNNFYWIRSKKILELENLKSQNIFELSAYISAYMNVNVLIT